MNVVRVKDSVQFSKIAPAGFRILSAIDQVSAQIGVDLVITSGTDGMHSGDADPHHSGEAYDVRSHDLDPVLKEKVIARIMGILGWDYFYGFIENQDGADEHFHLQRKKNTIYPPKENT